MGHPNHKCLYQGYSSSMDTILFQAALGPFRLGSLAAPSSPGRHGPLRAILPLLFATPQSRFSHLQAPQTRFAAVPRPKAPNCHNHWTTHWLISYKLLPVLPYSSVASASPYGNLAFLCWRSWCGMVGVELPRRKRGIKGSRPSTLAVRPTYY